MMKLLICLLVSVIAVQAAAVTFASVANDTRQMTFGYSTSTVSSCGSGSGTDACALADGSGVLFTANPRNNERKLFVVSTGAEKRGQVKLVSQSDPVNNENVDNFWMSPNQNWVVFKGELEINNVDELFANGVWGGDIARISGPVPNGGANNAPSLVFKPDSGRVMWYAQQAPSTTGNIPEIFTNVRSGDSLKKLNQDLQQNPSNSTNKVATRCDVTLVNEGVVYYANPGPNHHDDPRNLYVVNWDGSNRKQISPESGNPSRFGGTTPSTTTPADRWSPDKAYIVYQNDENTQSQNDLYSYKVSDGTRAKLNPAQVPQTTDAGFTTSRWQITPDSKSVVFCQFAPTETTMSLYSVDITGENTAKLATGVNCPTVRVTSDSKWAVYTITTPATATAVAFTQLYASRIGVDGVNEKILLNSAVPANGVGVVSWSVVENPGLGDAKYTVLFTFNSVAQTATVAAIRDLYATALPDGADKTLKTVEPKALSTSQVAPGVNDGFGAGTGIRVSPNKKWVVYRGTLVTNQKQVLKVGIDGSVAQSTLLPETFSNTNQAAGSFQIASTGLRVVGYVADGSVAPAVVARVWSVTLEEETVVRTDITPVPENFIANNYISSWQIAPNGESVLFYAQLPDPAKTQNGYWTVSVKGGDFVKASFDGLDSLNQGPQQGTPVWLSNGDIVYAGDYIANNVNDFFRNKNGAAALAPMIALVLAAIMMF